MTLPAGGNYTPVKIAVWDSGVDTKLFPHNLATANGSVPVIAFDRFSEPAKGELQPIPDALKSKVPQLKSYLKGFSDLQSNIDSPEASEVKSYMSTLKPDEYKAFVEEIGLAGNWMHGTHVAGIAVAGNPYARLVVGRIEFDWHLIPDPCPTRELALRDAKNAQSYVDFFKQQGVRVVNMSWGGSVKDIEDALELCNIGKTPDERKAIARDYFDIQKNALTKAFASAPDILFVTAAGNSNEDATFVEDIPAGIVLPNLLTVGAVDKAGDEASFTSYGPTVKVHANGYQVESVIPGRREARRVGHVDGLAAGGEPRREDPRGQSEADAGAGDRAHPRQRRQDGRRPAHADQPEEDACRSTSRQGDLTSAIWPARRPNRAPISLSTASAGNAPPPPWRSRRAQWRRIAASRCADLCVHAGRAQDRQRQYR